MKSISVRFSFGMIGVLFLFGSFAAASVSDMRKHILSRHAASIPDSSQGPAFPSSLKDAYLAAIEQASGPVLENIKIQTEILNQARESEGQVTGALFPVVTGTAQFLTQPTPAPSANAIANALYPAVQDTIKISIDQPLFRGLRDFAVLRQRKYLVDAQVHTLLNAARQLYYDVAVAYYNVIAYQEDETNFRLQILDSKNRLKDLQAFYKIGRSQLTDVLTFRSTIASLEAQLAQAHGQLEVARDTLSIFTGWDRSTVLKKDEKAQAFKLEAMGFYLNKTEQRADVQAAMANVKAYEEGVPMAWGNHLPNADLLGNYYFARPGQQSSINWDVSVALSFPIFQGGIVQSQVRQARSIANQYSAVLSQVRKSAEQEVRIFYDIVKSDNSQLDSLGELLAIGKENYETEIKYYKNGLVTNLDVLTAMTTYIAAQKNYDHLVQIAKADFAKLQAATGERPEINIRID